MTSSPARPEPAKDGAPVAPRASSQTLSLLERQRRVLEMIVRGEALASVLTELCLTVEAEADDRVVASIQIVDHGRLLYGAAPGLPDDYIAAIDGMAMAADAGTCAAAVALGELVVTEDIAAAPNWAELAHWPLGLGLQAVWSMPVTGADGAVIATIGTYLSTKRGPTQAEYDLVATLARTASLAIERARSDAQWRQREARHEFLSRLGAALQTLGDPDAVVASAARMLADHLGANRCVYAALRGADQLEVLGSYPRVGSLSKGLWPVSAFGADFETAMRAGRSHQVDDSAFDLDIDPRIREAFAATHIRAAISVPLLRDGDLTAVMAIHQTTPRRWKDHELEVCEQVVARCWEAMERARVTSELRASELRYRAMVQANPECVQLVAPDGTLLQMNDAGLRMIEAEGAEAAVGQCVYSLISPGFREAFRAFNERVCHGEGGTLGFEIVGLKGTRRWMETTAVPLRWGLEGFAQLAVTRDVSDRVIGERALADSRARLDYAVRLSGIGFFYCDLPFDELVWDPRVKAHFFLPLDARVTIDMFYQRMHPDDRAPTRAAINRAIEDHSAYDVYYRTTDPHSDAFKWIRALGGTTYGDDGSPVRFDGVTVDVTQVKLNEDRLAELLEREREQARLLSEVAQAARTIYASTTVDSVVQVITEEARRIIGAHHGVASVGSASDQAPPLVKVSTSGKYPADAWYGSLASEPGIHAVVCGLNQAMRLSRAELAAYPHAQQPAHRPGQPAMRGWLAAPLVKQDGTNAGLIELSDRLSGEFSEVDEAILMQLAQIGSVALENSRLYEALREQDRQKDEFIATLAHELRNPLAPIRSGLPILAKGAEPELVQRTVKMMDRQITHLVRLVDDLLDVSRITHGKVALSRRVCALRELIESAVETSMPQVNAFGHALSVTWPDEAVAIDGDPTRLSQVLSNLLNNAAKYTPQGGSLRVWAGVEDSAVVIHVEDNGLGIPAEMLDRIFELFTQVDRSDQAPLPGLGIGLTLVRRLVEMHGGSVSAHSAGPGAGSRFTVRLPRLQAQPASATPTPRAPARSHAARRVLVVDDNRDAAEMLQVLLEMEGHQVRLAFDGHEAVSAAAAFEPQVAFVDIGLPGLNGFQVAEQLRRSAPPIRLFALTGWGTDDYRRRARHAGFEDHLVKPVDPDRLLELLRLPVLG